MDIPDNNSPSIAPRRPRYTPKPRFDKIKLFENVISVLFILVVLSLLSGFFPFSHPFFTRKTIEYLQQAGADSCTIDNVKVTPWKGISIKGLRIKEEFAPGRIYVLSAREASLSCNVVQLFFAARQLNKKEQLYSGDLFSFTPGKPMVVISNILHFLKKIYLVKKINLYGASLVYTHNGATRLRIDNFVLKSFIEGEKERDQTISGVFSAESTLLFNVFSIEQLKGTFHADDDRISFTRCKGKTIDGKIKGDFIFDIPENQIAHVELVGTDLNLAHSYTLNPSNKASVKGKADATVELFRSDFNLDSLRGRGNLTANGLEIANLPIQQSLVTALDIPQVANVQFKRIKSEFELHQGRLFTIKANGNGEMMNFRTDGWFETDGSMNQQIEGVFTKKFSESLPKAVQNSMEPTSGNERSFNCRVYGTFGDPKLELDKKMLKRAVGSMFEDVKEQLQGMFKKKSNPQ